MGAVGQRSAAVSKVVPQDLVAGRDARPVCIRRGNETYSETSWSSHGRRLVIRQWQNGEPEPVYATLLAATQAAWTKQ